MPDTNQLLYNLNTAVVINGQVTRQTEAEMAVLEPRINGTGSFTVAGTEATGDVVGITFTGKLFTAPVVVSVTSIAGDTDASIADRLAADILANATLKAFGLKASTDPVAAGKVDLIWEGPLGSFVTMTGHSTGAETFAFTQISGGSGPIIPNYNFQFMNNGGVVRLFVGRRVLLDSITLANLVNGGPDSTSGTFPCL